MKDDTFVTTEMFEDARKYWLHKLSGELNELNLITDFPSTTQYEAADYNVTINNELTEKLIRISKNDDLSLFVLLLTFFKILLYKFTHRQDIVVVSSTLKRSSQKYNEAIILRDLIHPEMTFKDLLMQVKQTVIDGYKQQFYPIRRLIKHLEIDKGISLFKIIMLLENIHDRELLKDITTEYQNDILLYLVKKNSEIKGNIHYNSKLFKRETLRKLFDCYLLTLTQVLNDTGKKLSDITLITGEEKQQILFNFNKTEVQCPKDKAVHEYFEEQALKTPGNIAVAFNERTLTYKELDEASRQLALTLRGKGVCLESIVGIMLERSPEMIVGIVAILKAGGAYLPIDSKSPAGRIRLMLEDANARILLTQKDLLSQLQGISPGREIIDPFDEEVYKQNRKYPDAAVGLHHLAYVIYTSGSTGRPKGVMIEHRHVVNFVKNPGYIDFIPGDSLIMTGAIGFDITTFEIWGPLLNGLALYLADEDTILDPQKMETIITKNKITILHLIPPLFNQLAAQFPDMFSGLKYFVIGGDLVRPRYINEIRERYRDLNIIHTYGPTENTTFSTFIPVERFYQESIPIGKPIDHSTVYIVDEGHQLLPVGIPGELCTGGGKVARGYLNNASATCEKFVKHPIFPDQIIYKTGDIGRWLTDGNIEFLGRMDEQVKVRGFRVELGEIETQLLKYDGIKDTIVTIKENNGNKYLCAYIVSAKEFVIAELKECLAQYLPSHMIPSYFVRLNEMPVTQNGKVDRKALPEPKVGASAEEYESPGNEVEKELVKAWQEVLAVDRVGINDNFFNIGGDSITAIQIAANLTKSRLKLEVRDLFANPTVKELAKCIKKIDLQHPVDSGIVEGDLELTPIQKYFFDSRFNDRHHFNQAVMLYRPDGFEEDSVREVFTKIVEHHDALRIVFQVQGNNILQRNRGVEQGKLFNLEVIDLQEGVETADEIERESARIQRTINLEQGPLVKLGLFKTTQGDHLLMVIHHLVVDGVSWRILVEDFYAGYQQLNKGEEINLPEKTDSFKYWAESLKEYSKSKRVLAEWDYWQGIENTVIRPLPKDHEVGNEVKKRKNIETVSMNLDEGMTGKLLRETNWAYSTEINDILLTALGMAVSQWAGIETAALMMEGHGRESIITDINVDRTVGWFTSLFPVILNMNRTWQNVENEAAVISYYIKTIKETLRHMPKKGIGYGILRYLNPHENKTGAEFKLEPEITFNYLGQFHPQIETGTLELSKMKSGDNESPDSEVKEALIINSMIMEGKFNVTFAYNKYEYERNTIEKLAGFYKSNLTKIINHCLEKKERELTPSDVGYNKMSLEDFESLNAHIKRHIGDSVEIKFVYPLTPMQRGMLVDSLKSERSSFYFGQNSLTFRGNLDPSLLEMSFKEMINRYDIFRTIFTYEQQDAPLQIVLKKREWKMKYEDISHLTPPGQSQYIDDFKKRDKEREFDLSMDMLTRIALFKKKSDLYELVWTTHHILMDGWCLGIIFQDFIRVYQALLKKEPIKLPAVIPYVNYINWLQEQDREEGLRYWHDYLEGYEQPAGLLKTEKPVQEDMYQFENYNLVIDETSVAGLSEIAAENRVTMNTVIQTLWGILLQKYNNTDDVVFGGIVSGRPPGVEGIERMVGLFINTVPVRIRTSGVKTFPRLLKEVQHCALLSREYEYVSLGDILTNSLLKNKLIDHIMDFQNYPVYQALEDANKKGQTDFRLESMEMDDNVDYHFQISVSPGKPFIVRFIFNLLVYERDFIKMAASHFNTIIEQVLKKPDIDIDKIEILSKEEKMKFMQKIKESRGNFPLEGKLKNKGSKQIERVKFNF